MLQSLSDVPAARYGSHHQFRPFGAPALYGRFSIGRLYAKRTEWANPLRSAEGVGSQFPIGTLTPALSLRERE